MTVVNILIGFGIVVAAIVIVCLRSKKRRRELDDIANTLGMSFEKKSSLDTSGQLSELSLFEGQEEGVFSERMWKQTSRLEVNLFGYHYSPGGGKTNRVKHAVVVYRSDLFNFPRMEILPEYWCDEASVAEEQRILLDHDTFNKHFFLKGGSENHEIIRLFMTPEFIDYLNRNRGIAIEANGSVLTFYRSVSKITPEITQGFIKQGKELLLLMLDEAVARELLTD